jgi:hypothetical protein
MKLVPISALMTTVFALIVAHASVSPPQTADKPVEQTRKNIQVLKGLPESQLFPAMNFVGDSLGVHCDYCHVKEADKWLWEKDDKKNKLIGREMMQMVIELNVLTSADNATQSTHLCFDVESGFGFAQKV